MLGGARAVDERADAVRVLIVEPHRLAADGLHLLVEQDEHLRVIATARAVGEATARIRELVPDVVLIARCLATRPTLEALGSARGRAALVIVGGAADRDLVRGALEAGAAGVVDEAASSSELVEAIRRAADGDALCSPSVIADVLRRHAGGERPSGIGRDAASLTRRERQVLGLLAEGCDSKGIASRLGLSVETARDYVQNILEKLDVHSRIQAVVRADRLGLITIAAFLAISADVLELLEQGALAIA